MAEFLPFQLTATAISEQVRSGHWQPRDVAEFYLERTQRYAAKLNSHLWWQREHVLAQVTSLENRLAAAGSKDSLPLAGVPVLIKDNICTRDVPTTCASKMLAGYRPPYDAGAVERLVAAGAIVFGKTNCDEFGMGSSSENSAFGPVKNPWDQERVPGGSSGGSAAAVAADLAPVALGSDTGGSIRQPAAFCGILGLKPTYGLVSRYGLVAYASSLDQIGPFARNAADLALVASVIAGHDPRDSTSQAATVDWSLPAADASAPQPLLGRTFGLVRELFGAGLEAGSRTSLDAAVAKLVALGASVVELSLPSLTYSIAAYYLIAAAEASANLARYDGVRYGHRHEEAGQALAGLYKHSRSEGFGPEVKRRIMLGAFALSAGYYDAYYAQATRARHLLMQEFAAAFAKVDLLLAPAAPTTAFKLGEKSRDPLAMYLGDICTLGVNLAGLPALALPCGFDQLGLPVGLQLIGPALSEAQLLRTAQVYETATQWAAQRQPAL